MHVVHPSDHLSRQLFNCFDKLSDGWAANILGIYKWTLIQKWLGTAILGFIQDRDSFRDGKHVSSYCFCSVYIVAVEHKP